MPADERMFDAAADDAPQCADWNEVHPCECGNEPPLRGSDTGSWAAESKIDGTPICAAGGAMPADECMFDAAINDASQRVDASEENATAIDVPGR